jgi:hypothetical protein
VCHFVGGLPETSKTSLTYLLRREEDELYLQLKAIGFREVRWLKHRWLQRITGFADPLLIFTLPPQHFAETAIGVRLIPAVVTEKQLGTITLLPSENSQIVFRP